METKLELGVYRYYNKADKTYETLVLTKAFNKFYWSKNNYATKDFKVIKKGLFGKRKRKGVTLDFNFYKNQHSTFKAEITSTTSFQIEAENSLKKFTKTDNLSKLENKEITLKLTLLLFIGLSLFFGYKLIKPYLNTSLESQKITTTIPEKLTILSTTNTFLTSKGVGKLRFPVVKEEQSIDVYVTIKNSTYKTYYTKALGEEINKVLPVLDTNNEKEVNFDVSAIKQIKMLYNSSDIISELSINNTVVKPFEALKFKNYLILPLVVVTICFLGFSYLLYLFWNEP